MKEEQKRERNMLTKLDVKNYRSIEEMTLDFGLLTVLVGPNGAGKSNVIDVLRFVRDALRLGLENAILNRHGMSALRRWSPKGRPYDVHIELCFHIHGEEVLYAFTLGSIRRGEYKVKWEKYTGTQEGKPFGYEIKDGRWVEPPYDEQHPELASYMGKKEGKGEMVDPEPQLTLFLPRAFLPFGSIQPFIQEMGFYTIYPNLLREPQKPANPYPLDERAQNLASVLKSMKRDKHARPSFGALLEALSLAVEGISDISVAQAGGYLVTRLHHGQGGPAFPLAQESDGTLRLLGLLTALYQFPPRSLLAIEEPELTVHPGALGVLRDALLEISERSQLLVTTHSPDLLYDLPAETLRVVEKVDNITVVGKVAEEQRQAIAKKLFFPGELMRMEGLRRAKNGNEKEKHAQNRPHR
jgi:predicted ATPase